jgi:hypothetical protein
MVELRSTKKQNNHTAPLARFDLTTRKLSSGEYTSRPRRQAIRCVTYLSGLPDFLGTKYQNEDKYAK